MQTLCVINMKIRILLIVIFCLLLSNLYFAYRWIGLNNSVNRAANELLVILPKSPLKIAAHSYMTLDECGSGAVKKYLASIIEVTRKDIPDSSVGMTPRSIEAWNEINDLLKKYDEYASTHNNTLVQDAVPPCGTAPHS